MNKFRVLYEDNHLLCVVKPPNIPVQEDKSCDGDVLSLLKQYVKEKYNKAGDVYLGLVHRLDRPVGGAMVFARTSKAASRLSKQIRSHEMKKTYLAVVQGSYSWHEGTYQDYLTKDRDNNRVTVVCDGSADSREAVLKYQVLQERDGKALVKINLITGRSHQIRVQFSHHGHPLIGDRKYGGAGERGFTNHLALWSCQLSFKHPVKDEIINIMCLPPEREPWELFSAEIEKRIFEEGIHGEDA